MPIGTVKWFNNAKGYGFILPEQGGGDVFAHYSTIDMDGYKTLKAGQQVQFEAVDGPKGLQASSITSVNGAPVALATETVEEDATPALEQAD